MRSENFIKPNSGSFESFITTALSFVLILLSSLYINSLYPSDDRGVDSSRILNEQEIEEIQIEFENLNEADCCSDIMDSNLFPLSNLAFVDIEKRWKRNLLKIVTPPPDKGFNIYNLNFIFN